MTDPAPPPPAPDDQGDRPAPSGAFPLYGPRFQTEPAELYREMRRRHGAVAPVLLDGDVPAWLVLGYREVHYVTGNPNLFARDSRRWNAWSRIPPDWPLRTLLGFHSSVLYAEGAEHRRRSGAISDSLAAVDPFELRTHCERVADGLIDVFAGSGEADLVPGYADQIPLLVMARILGMAESETAGLVRDFFLSVAASEGAIEADERNRERMRRLLDLKRERPGADVATRLIGHPAALGDKEIVDDLMVVMGAGQLPTSCWIGNTLRLMLTDDRFALTLAGGRRSVRQALNEVLWADTPTQNFAGRFAVRDTHLGGQHIKAGDLVILGLAAANNDPKIRPDAYADSGGNQAHLSFSHGEHRCPHAAQELAEVIAETAIEVLLDRLPDVRLAVADEALGWRPSPWMRGLAALPVRFTPAYVAADLR
ncbi:MAG TPA: cytochrome P450 [Streptosporangiaceae bacterium]|nr:cytochrome P450 [Streptosporangiaceae bacterium]